MKKALMFMTAIAIALPGFAQTAAPARVAVIDVQKVLTQSDPGKAAFERLKKLQEERAGKIQAMNDELKNIEGQLTSKSMSLSEDKIAQLRKQFDDKKIALQRYAQDAERELGEARDRSLQDMEKQIMPVINQLGKEMGFAMIFNKFEAGLVYASEAVDITDVVVKRFNDTLASKTGSGAAQQAAVKN